ncbi:MAG: hypothetical protein JNG90_14655 [Planctomycetaceae bacterium]|nr:hypothetical protein [Planctomycetaceae bacterium]
MTERRTTSNAPCARTRERQGIARSWALLAVVSLAVAAPAPAAADEAGQDPFAPSATLAVPAVDAIRSQALEWLAQQGAAASVQAQGAEIWGPAVTGGDELLARLAATIALGHPAAAELVALCQAPPATPRLPDAAWLLSADQPPLVASNLRLLYGRWLAQNRLYDEAHAQLSELDPAKVVDPAALLFYQAVVAHRMLQREAGLQALARLQHDVADCPERYRALAGMLETDLKGLEDDSLDHISRRMEDIRRRLDLGRAGPKTRAVEDGVIASLDKLIEEMEQQQQQQQQQSSSGGGNTQPSSPAPDSGVLGGSGPGETRKRNIGNESGWGALPPKERQQAMQQIGKDFPSHYRDVVEQYFRKLASEDRPASEK